MSNLLTRYRQRLCSFSLSEADIYDGIKSACDFFNIPMPRMIEDLSNVANGQTMFVNWDRGSYYDDVLCFNMRQLVDMKVDSKSAFSLVMTHECAHRVLQNTVFPGINNGAWENELAADFLMGCRAGLWQMDDAKVCLGLAMTGGSPSHPEGCITVLFIRHGKYVSQDIRRRGIPLTIQNLINEFMRYRQENIGLISQYQRRYYRF